MKAPVKRWQVVWESTGVVELTMHYRWVARLAAWDANRHRRRKRLAGRLVVKDGLGDTRAR